MSARIRTRLLASFFVAALVVGAAAVIPASAEDDGAATDHTNADANPIDTSITTQRPIYFRCGLKTHDSKKTTITHSSGDSRSYRYFRRGAKRGVVRNAIGQPVQQTITEIKGTNAKASEHAGVSGALNNGNSGTQSDRSGSQSQGSVPLWGGGGTPHDPRTTTALNPSIINGRDMVRPSLGARVIGGPTKNVADVISGASFRSKHR
jgi:hypothetical protein